MFCGNCGNDVSKKEKICGKCGYGNYDENKEKKLKRLNTIRVIGTIAIFVLAILVLFSGVFVGVSGEVESFDFEPFAIAAFLTVGVSFIYFVILTIIIKKSKEVKYE